VIQGPGPVPQNQEGTGPVPSARKRKRKRKFRAQTLVFVLPAVVLVSVFLLYPVIQSLVLSLYANKEGGGFVGLANFAGLFRGRDIVNVKGILAGRPPFGALVNNLAWIAIHLPLSMLLGLSCALLMIRLPKMAFLRTFIFIGMLVPGVVTGIVTLFLFEKDTGMISVLFGLLGIEGLHVNWFARPQTALMALILTSVWTWTGYSMVVFMAALTAIPQSYLEAGIVDGANAWQLLRFIKLPLLRSSIGTIVVMSVINELTSFDLVYSSTFGGPGGASNVMGFQMYLEAFRYFKFGTGSAIATLITLVAAVPIIVNVRNSVRQS
jgi:multiple sugar transport system permease protein